jgi:hypothetical protein
LPGLTLSYNPPDLFFFFFWQHRRLNSGPHAC